MKTSTLALTALLVGLATPAFAGPPLAEMTDIRADHWATQALKTVVEQYGLMEGFPDKTFKGGRNLTRFEFAAALRRVMETVEQKLGQGAGVPQEALKIIKDLQQEYKNELESLKRERAAQNQRFEKLEAEINKLNEAMTVRFGGSFGANVEDNYEDNKRPFYGASFGLDANVKVFDGKGTIRGNLNGTFSNSLVENKDKAGELTEEAKVELDMGSAWYEYTPAGKEDAFQPKFQVGYFPPGRAISTGTSLTHYFNGFNSIMGNVEGAPISVANPSLNKGSKWGIRMAQTFVGSAGFTSGPFKAALAATPNLFMAGAGVDLGWLKLKLAADMDQAMVVGEPVQDPLSNESVIVDIGNETFGLSLQGTFQNRFTAQNALVPQFRAASALISTGFGGFRLGTSAKFENYTDTDQQLIAGAFFKTPDKVGDTNIPSLLVGAAQPFAVEGGNMFLGSKTSIGDRAGLMVQVSYENPWIPGLTLEYGHRAPVLFAIEDRDIISNTWAISSYYEF